MYYYVYDPALSQRKYAKTMARIETRITDLGIGGKSNRLSFLKNVDQLLAQEIDRGLQTIVVVGNDDTLYKVINLVADLPLTIGYIPAMGPSAVATYLGVPLFDKACDVISSRIIAKIDLGRANNYYFLSSAVVAQGQPTLECDDSFFLSTTEPQGQLVVVNLDYQKLIGKPSDGLLEAVILPPPTRGRRSWRATPQPATTFLVKHIVIGEQPATTLVLDGQTTIKSPCLIDIVPAKIKMIVGRQRSI